MSYLHVYISQIRWIWGVRRGAIYLGVCKSQLRIVRSESVNNLERPFINLIHYLVKGNFILLREELYLYYVQCIIALMICIGTKVKYLPRDRYVSTLGIVSYILTYVSKMTEVAARSAHDSLPLLPLESCCTGGIVLTLFWILYRNSTRIHGSFLVPSKIRQIH